MYLVSGRYAGIEYFSVPVSTSKARPDSVLTVLVYDTASTAPVKLEARHVVVTRPTADGMRSVLDLIILQNSGRRTRVAPDSLHPSWSGPLPRGSVGLDVGESDISSGAVGRRGDSLVVTAALSPGEKQLTVEYQIPDARKALELAVDGPGVTVNVMAEEPGVVVQGQGLTLADTQVIQGRSFRRWSGMTLSPGLIRITLPQDTGPPQWMLMGLVGAVGIVLILAGGYLVLHRAGSRAPAPEHLVSAIAALDLRYLGREAEVPGEEWTAYQKERARLKAELQACLAGSVRTS